MLPKRSSGPRAGGEQRGCGCSGGGEKGAVQPPCPGGFKR